MDSDPIQRIPAPDAESAPTTPRKFQHDDLPVRDGAGDDKEYERDWVGRSAAPMDNSSTDRWRRSGESGDAIPDIRADEPVGKAVPGSLERPAYSNGSDGLLFRIEPQQQQWSGSGSATASADTTGSVAVLPPISTARSPVGASKQGTHSRPFTPGANDSPTSSPAPAAPSRDISGASTPITPSIGNHPYNINDEHRVPEGAAAVARDSNRALRAEWDRYKTGSVHRERELERALPPFLSEHRQRDEQPSRQPQQYEYDQRERELGPNGHLGDPAAGDVAGDGLSDGPVTLGQRQRPVRVGFEHAEQHQRDEHRAASFPCAQHVQSWPLRDEPHSPVYDAARGRVGLVGTGTRSIHGGDNGEREHDRQRGDVEWGHDIRQPVDGSNDYPGRASRGPIHALRSLNDPTANEQPDGQFAVHAAGSPPIATLESPSSAGVSPPASPSVLSAESRHSQPVSSAGRSSTTTPNPDATAPSAALNAPRLPVAFPDGSPQTQSQQQRQHVGIAPGHSSGTPPYRAQRERDASYTSQPSSVTQRSASPSSGTSAAIAAASAVPV
jgi:hypothetical protein